jgi:single-stranded-DNA-specific exonuclease
MAIYEKLEKIPKSVADELKEYSPLMQTLLFYRGVRTKEDADVFLNPRWERDVQDPFLIHDMDRAVDRILEAIEHKQKILIYGDYDADGIPGSVVLHDFFKKIGYDNFSNYIPHRHNEGYGLGISAVEMFADENVELIITVDVGITDIESVAFAKEKNIDVIVTDHHMPLEKDGKEILPDAYAVLNSKKTADTYHDDMLCGAGVAFKLVQALIIRGKERGMFADISDGWEKWLLDMAGLSTIADMVPLQKENRALAHFGLKVLRKSRRIGLQTLLRKIKIEQQHLSEDDIGYMLVPRINAASRIDHPLRAFELLATDSPADAEHLAEHLDTINDKRKGHVASMMRQAHKRLSEKELRDVIVIGDPSWLPGVLGLVASKLVEEYNRPAFVWGYDSEGKIKGSYRGNNTISILELLRKTGEDTFVQFGGHAQAGGFSVLHEHIHTLEDVLSELFAKHGGDASEHSVFVDSSLALSDVTWNTYAQIEKLAPFGVGNEKPIFVFENITLNQVALFGKEQNHLRLECVGQTGERVSAIGFFMTTETFPNVTLGVNETITLIATMEKSMFRNYPELRLRIENILPKDALGES